MATHYIIYGYCGSYHHHIIQAAILCKCQKQRMEKIINPEVIELVKDGRMDEEGMIKSRIGIKEY